MIDLRMMVVKKPYNWIDMDVRCLHFLFMSIQLEEPSVIIHSITYTSVS